MLVRVLLSFTLLSAAALPLAAQNAALLVRVNGAQGPVAGARVEVHGGEAVAASSTADSAGLARLVGLAAGTYRVRVEAIGYAPRVLEGITLAAGQAAGCSGRTGAATTMAPDSGFRRTRATTATE